MMLHICVNGIMWLSFIWWIKRYWVIQRRGLAAEKQSNESAVWHPHNPARDRFKSRDSGELRHLRKSHSDSVSVSSAWKPIYLSMRLIYSSCCLLSPWLLVCKRDGFVKRSFSRCILTLLINRPLLFHHRVYRMDLDRCWGSSTAAWSWHSRLKSYLPNVKVRQLEV